MKCPSLIIACTFLIVSIYPTIAFNFGGSRSYAFSFPGRQTERSLTRAFAQVDVTVEKPLGITLEENEADEAKGVFCNSFSEESAAFAAGVRPGDIITAVGEKDTTLLTFDAVMEVLSMEESPVALTLERPDTEVETPAMPAKAPVKLKPKKMPSAQTIARVATNKNVWMKDPLYLSSAVFAVGLPLLLLIASSGSH